ncbi:2-octaprenyl-6-methoxyphenol hydroxylase [Aliiroseovarius sp. xm-m-379]|uniref:FAD-dependent monooxygenase n=1 Tax=unclassified Aliiroseovarius TaxID=2623558 RepID=UPI00156874C0|nr:MULTISPECIES: FAD-dependent monooxygenase [unclassified Aliiroseovarius]NRP26290.1 2-octaprenyl-6-methoxyphenol hydroxylase [Aliiroseovarius sp. xm-m-379]NRP31996.1 2-octaprenyl-6-methoxyphenol hydroxylase [Aliiroseovarius sp. xm-m-314]NRP35089.1 2-octaprenyl-6-methoxyphenol hydroxylase [Aliiroseovarius sp. xm-a-104]NRP45829.1 2-octaprenyl-6-methoxyphenol hydroxylase [Aliiroseovarius sp. xm-m-378]NRP51358.1 2-octaprenyl-6-methoxyphenol hydroxylase [Aliiroseovarius sp. xm-m-354]
MKLDADILIVGGGLNGPALGLALADCGFDVTIVDAMPKGTRGADDFDGRGYALALASQRLLSAIGVWPRVAPHSQPLLDIRISDGRAGEGPGPFVLEFDHAEIDEGPMGYMVEDRFLSRAFLDAVEAHPKITLIDQETVVAQEVGPASVTLTLGSGKTLTGQIVVGCDGRRSGTCERAGIKRWGHDYGQTSLVCAVDHALPHNGAAHQFFMPPGPLAILPLPGNQSSIVWTESHEDAARIQGLDDAGYLDELRPRFGSFLGEIGLAGKRFTYPLNLTVAEAFVSDRLALVGDAAHGMHPIAGQGLNAGLKDVATLAEVLTLARRRGEDIGRIDVLERYQQWRRWDVMQMVGATELTNRLFSNDNPILRATRDIGLGVVNAFPGLRRGFIREAAGLTGDLPKLLQGRQI